MLSLCRLLRASSLACFGTRACAVVCFENDTLFTHLWFFTHFWCYTKDTLAPLDALAWVVKVHALTALCELQHFFLLLHPIVCPASVVVRWKHRSTPELTRARGALSHLYRTVLLSVPSTSHDLCPPPVPNRTHTRKSTREIDTYSERISYMSCSVIR